MLGGVFSIKVPVFFVHPPHRRYPVTETAKNRIARLSVKNFPYLLIAPSSEAKTLLEIAVGRWGSGVKTVKAVRVGGSIPRVAFGHSLNLQPLRPKSQKHTPSAAQ